eukprot:6196401-Pleurochrysis_carterae.AAC.2
MERVNASKCMLVRQCSPYPRKQDMLGTGGYTRVNHLGFSDLGLQLEQHKVCELAFDHHP